MTSLRGTVVVSSPGAPPVRATAPGGGRVLVAPGVQGPPGHGVNLAGAVPTYADLPELTVSDAGQAYMVQDDGRLYVWSGVSWPADGAGAQFRGEMGPEGRGIRVVSVDGNDLLLGMTDGSTVRASVPALAAAVAARDVAVAARADAVSARTGAELARDGAVDAADRAEGAADGVAADAVAAGDAAGRAEVAADAADASAAAAAVDAAEVDDAREYVSGVHESWLPGGDMRTALDILANATFDASAVAWDASIAAAASATAAGASATAAAGDAATATGARDAAVSAADSAQGSATAAAVDAGRAESAAAGVDQVVSDAAGVLAGEIADDVAASQAARSGAESARDQAVASAEATAVDAAEVGEAREYVSGVHEDFLPGGDMRTTLDGIVWNAAVHATEARDARDAAAASAAAMQARPAMWMWDGTLPWTAPPEAMDTDTVLNTSTGEIHAIVEVTA